MAYKVFLVEDEIVSSTLTVESCCRKSRNSNCETFTMNKEGLAAFIVTLAGMFFARGLSFIISVEAITITNPFYKAVSLWKLRLLGGYFVSSSVIIR